MRLWPVIGVLLGLLMGCGATARKIRGPDGDMWWHIGCRHSHEECLEKAGDLCPDGYAIGDSSGGEDGAVAYSSGNVTVVRGTYRGEMLIKCR